MKKIYLLAAAAALFAACSSSDDLAVKEEQPQVQSEPGAIGFDAYLQRATTRAGGAIGDIDLAKLKTSSFGVFGFYTDNNDYDPQSLPNFMYNQKVEWKTVAPSGYWEYTPVMYWPNEYGNSAISDDNDKVSFFAYAPYVEVVPATGKITASADQAKWGITGMSRNSNSGDPIIKYIVSFKESEMVDLCWGVCEDPTWGVIQGNIQQINNGESGKPWLNVQRPKDPTALGIDDGQKIKFQFKHALAQLNVQVDADVDGINEDNEVDSKTRVYIRSITFTGISTKGALNLNNIVKDKALWMDYSGTADLESGQEVTIQDGRKDGKEGASGAEANNEITGLNPLLVQNAEWSTGGPQGVKKTAVNLFNFEGAQTLPAIIAKPIYVIPTGESMKVTIVYDIETEDDKLAPYVSDGKQHGVSIENRIEKEINFGSVTSLENGKKYTIKLHLGMNSVKFDAAVTEWEPATATDVELPSNTPKFAAGDNSSYDWNVIATSTGENTLWLTGFQGGETVTGAVTEGTVMSNPTNGTANSAGDVKNAGFTIANEKFNMTVKKVSAGKVAYTGTSGKKVVLNVYQLPHALGLVAPSISDDASSFTIAQESGVIVTWTDGTGSDMPATEIASRIIIYKNGVKLDYKPSDPGANQFSWDASTKTITLGAKAHTGDIFSITVQAGEAPSETQKVTVPNP